MLLIKKNVKIKWEAQARINQTLDSDLASLIKRSGAYNLFIGLESGSDKILKLMNKGFDTKAARSFFKTLRSAGIHFEVSLIFGYPGEEIKDFKETINFILKNKKNIPKIAQANPFVDYLKTFKSETFPRKEGISRVKKFLKILEVEKLKYTKSFINNLIDEN